MFTTVFSIALLASLPFQGALADASGLTLNSPSITECGKVDIQWSGGQGPYNVLVVPANDPCNGVLADLGDHDNDSLEWVASLPAGTIVQLSLQDSKEDEAWSSAITIAPGTDKSCLSAASNSSSSQPLADPQKTALTVPPNVASTPAAPPPTSSTPAAVPVGAANAGEDPLGLNDSGVAAAHKFSAVALGVTVLAAIFATGF
jgi:hypothetical protein